MIFGIVLLFIFTATENRTFLWLSLIFLILNLFNLLPFFPLDGGRFLHEILFSRNRYVELIFRFTAALSLLLLAWVLKWWILGIIGFLNLITVQFPFKCAGIANELKGLFTSHGLSVSEQNISGNIPTNLYKRIIDMIYDRFASNIKAKAVASYVMDVVDRLYVHPPKPLPTAGLLFSYLFLLFFPFVASFAITINSRAIADMFIDTEIVTYETSDGKMLKKQQISAAGNLYSEKNLSEDGKLYHGKSFSYYQDDTLKKEGHWKDGKWHGQWKSYDKQGNLQSETEFENGKFISQREFKEGGWVEISWDDLPANEKRRIDTHNKKAPHGPKVKNHQLKLVAF